MTAFTDIDALKKAILENSPADFFEDFVVRKETPHFGADKLEFVSDIIQNDYGVKPNQNELIVVGSSKIGVALHNKIKEGKIVAPAFRQFGIESDIDLSICCPDFLNLLWHQISAYMCKQRYMPFRYKKFGDYLGYGWLRSDQFPSASAPHLVKCDNLRFALGKIRKDRRRGHPKISFGIFHDIEHLTLYQARSISLCRQNLENPL